ncbi:alkaline phosphatase [Planomicrobium sp. CPCC 101079]|uniref:alkaline phosphatase n=1 Tax=Planomicrobium sp. CPCC 101079 TaxID=2599618 RepID=UPI0011B6EECE|nr:alkaline phosphatase [Planomicrobium sp. CPCC 101079]TWT00552.1 alkaline phosphatase [Planomicrobium sp. CPCC 101079]
MTSNFKKKAVGVSIAAAVALSSLGFATTGPAIEAKNKKNEPTNVIMMVMDGTSAGATNLAKWYKGGDLTLDSMLVGGMHTHSAESAITDSAPAATALATGNKSNDKVVGLLPKVVTSPGVDPVAPEDVYKPVANVLEGAELQGKSTGIISTSEIQHATPAGFSSHATHRTNYQDIAEQQVYQGIEVVLGGGKESLEPGTTKNARVDGENLVDVINENGYDFVESRDELLNSDSDKLWGSFAPSALAYDFDREATANDQPSLADMTKKGIETLSKDEDGFFLFVEGSKVDWAAHANDTIGIISEVLAFDAAVKEAVEFAKKDGNTMVIAVSDHGNSGITMGNQNTNSSYPETPVSDYIEPLKKASMTIEGALKTLKSDRSNIEEAAALYGLDNLTEDEVNKLKASKNVQSDMVKMLAQRANIGYTTGGHTGEDVFLYAYGPSKPFGLVDNTDIAKTMAEFMDFDLEKTSDKLFVNAKDAFEKKGYKTRIDVTDKNNPVFVAEKNKTTIELPVNKDVAHVTQNNKTFTKTLDGVTVYNGEDFFVSKEAFNLSK